MNRYYIACDLGSSQCKTALFREDGTACVVVDGEYPSHFPRKGWVEQDPEDWYEVCCNLIRKVIEQSGVSPGDIKGVGIAGVSHNAVLLDSENRALANTILLYDTRSQEQVDKIGNTWGFERIRDITLNDITTVWTWPQLLWIKEHNREVWDRTKTILFQKDYVRNRLAPSLCTDYIDAHGSLLFDPIKGDWIGDYCSSLGLKPDQLPKIVSPTDIVGSICSQGAADTGLPEGTPVIAGTTDTVAEVLGAGGIEPNIGTLKLASVGRITVVRDEPIRKAHILNYRHVIDGLWYPGTASKSAAFSFRWLKELLYPDCSDPDIFREMDFQAESIPPGSNGLMFHPHIMGEWAPHWNSRMKGNFIGLQAGHTRGNLIRAALEGIAFSLRDAFEEMEISPEQIKEFKLIGQGAKSSLWCRITADVFNHEVFVPKLKEAVFGAGIITIMGITGKPLTDFEHLFREGVRYEPQVKNAETYRNMLEIYREADKSLLQVYEKLSQF